MKIKRLLSFGFIIALLLNMCSQITFADENYEKCIIPIISDKVDVSEELTWNGLKRDEVLYVTLEDACKLTDGEIVKQSDKDFVTKRNTVKLFGDINDNEACLCVSELDALLFSWDGEDLIYPQAGLTNRILFEQPFHLDITYFEDKVWVDLFSYVNCFGADINILTENSESYKYLGEINLTQFDGCYTIEIGTPFDEIYTEFMNNSELQFKWVDYGQKVGVFVAKGYDAVINDYQNIFTQIYYDKYNSSNAYYDVLLKVLQCRPINFGEENDLLENLEKFQENYDKQVNRNFFVADRFLKGNDPLIEKAKDHLEVSKVIYSAATDSAKIEQKYITLIDTVSKMNGIELSILQKSLLDAEVKDEQAYSSKNPADYVSDYSQFMKKVFPALSGVYSTMESSATKFQKIFESYSSLYDSANKLNDEIQDPSKLTQEKYNEMAEYILTFAGDTFVGKAIDKFAPQAKPIFDVYDIVLKEMKSDTMTSVADTAQAHFIQQTVLRNVKLDKSDASYYSMLMAMQSSYFANKNMMNIDANVSKEQAALAASDNIKKTNILSQLENLITQGYECNRNFYNSPATDWKNQLIEKVTGDYFGKMPDYTISTELYKQESAIPINWYLEPNIEAEDIIVSDIEKHTIYGHTANPFDEYSIVKQNGKYRFIKYDGTYINDKQYDKWYFSKPNAITCLSESNESITILGENNNEISYTSHDAGWGKQEFYIDNKMNDIFYIEYGSYYKYSENNNVVVQSADISLISNEKNQLGVAYDIQLNNIGKYGIANNNGLVVDCVYNDACMNIGDDIIALKKDRKWGYFNKDGTKIIDFICESFESKILDAMWLHNHDDENIPHPFLSSSGYIPIKINGKCGYYDTQGNEVIPCGTFEDVRPVHNGLAWVKKDGKWGVIKLKKIETEPTSQISAVDLIDKTIPEIIDIMNGEYQIIKTENDGYIYIQNQSVLSGMEFYISVSGDDIVSANNGEEIHSDTLKSKLESGKLTLDGIQVNQSGKVSDSIQADMDYKSCSTVLGDFDCIGGSGGYLSGSTESASYTYDDKNAKIILHFSMPSEIITDLSLGKISSVSAEQMKSYNPKLENVVVRKAETVTDVQTEPTESISVIPKEASTYNGHSYVVYPESMTWQEAKEYCEKLGGHLVTISNADEQKFVEDLAEKFTDKTSYWLGGYYSDSEWKWVDDTKFSYTNWDSWTDGTEEYRQPDNHTGNEFYLRFANKKIQYSTWYSNKGKWNDVSNEADGTSGDVPLDSFGLICEWDSISKISGDNNNLLDNISSWSTEQIINSINAYLKENWCRENQYYCFEEDLTENNGYLWVCIRWDGSNSANAMCGSDVKIDKATGEAEISFLNEPYEWFNIQDYP